MKLQLGQVVKDGKVISEQHAYFNPASYCPNPKHHGINPKNIDRIKMTPIKQADKNGKIKIGRQCPECFLVRWVDKSAYFTK